MLSRITVFFLLIIFKINMVQAQVPSVSAGQIIRLERFSSRFVTQRHVDILLPDRYDSSQKYCVLYLHDGQMLFDSSLTWNGQSWEVDQVISRLIDGGKIRPVIVVGIWNGVETRHSDYFPQKPFESLTTNQQDELFKAKRTDGEAVFKVQKVNSDDYLKFIIQELKPYIDSHFPTIKGLQGTYIAGSSMGGLISLYAICEYPKVFGGAACLSTHWPGIFTMENNPVPDAFVRYLDENLPNPRSHKIYFDFGTATLDSLYEPLQNRVDIVMKHRGYSGKNWMTLKFPGEDHSERAWRTRLEVPLLFLLGK